MHASTIGRSAPLRFTTIRELAHITSVGALPRVSQQLSVISGTTAVASHLGEKDEVDRIERVEPNAVLLEQARIAATNDAFRFAGVEAASNIDMDLVSCQPLHPLDRRFPGSGAALKFVERPCVVVDGDADGEPRAEVFIE